MKPDKTKSSKQNSKSGDEKVKPYKKPASISKHAKIIGSLGGRPRKNAQIQY